MGQSYNFLAATVGHSLLSSRDGGQSWQFAMTDAGPPGSLQGSDQMVDLPFTEEMFVAGVEGSARALALDPQNPKRLYVGSDGKGIYRSENNGQSWTHLPSPMEGQEIWSIAVDPRDSDKIFVGARPDAYRSRDGGATWEKLPIGLDATIPLWPPRITAMVVDPRDSRTVWAGAEIGGVYRSSDGGDTWTRLAGPGPGYRAQDVHSLGIHPERPIVYMTGPSGIATSVDEGQSWKFKELAPLDDKYPGVYCRKVLFKADDPDTIFVGAGNLTPGEVGGIRRSRDAGESWETLSLPETPDSVIYWLATHEAIPHVIVASSLYGEIFLSEDGGEDWRKVGRRLGHVRGIAVLPN